MCVEADIHVCMHIHNIIYYEAIAIYTCTLHQVIGGGPTVRMYVPGML